MERSAEYEGLLRQAEAAWRAEEYESAGALFREAAALMPEDAESAFFAQAANALAEGAEYRLIAPLAQAAEQAIVCAARSLGSGKAYFGVCGRVAAAMVDVNARHNEAVSAYLKKETKKLRRTPEALAGAQSLFADCAATASAAAKRTAGAALEHAQDLSAADEYFWNVMLTLLDDAGTFRFEASLESDPEIAALLEVIDQLRGNVFGDYAGVEELPEDAGEYVEAVCPACGETLSFDPQDIAGEKTAECPFCGQTVVL